MLTKVRGLYESISPKYLKALWYLPQPFEVHHSYIRKRREIYKMQCETYREKCEIQKQSLAKILIYAIENVPYYKQLMGGRYDESYIYKNTYDVLMEFPIISKSFIQDNQKLFISRLVNDRKCYMTTTGGTTGAPLKILLSNSAWFKEWAFVYDYLSKYGVGPKNTRISLRGVRFKGVKNIGAHIFEENPIYHEVRISPFHLSEKYIDEIVEKIKEVNPVYIHAYPSAIKELISLVGSSGRDIFKSVKACLLVSENVSSSEVEIIEKQIGCDVASFYGHSERACFAPRNKENGLWIPHYMYGVSEVRNSKIIATGFNNYAMPFIRYDTEDVVVTEKNDSVVSPGEGFTEIEGRWQHGYLVGASGQKITMTALNTHIEEMKYVRRYQFYQKMPGQVLLRLAMNQCDDMNKIINTIKKEFEEKCGGELCVTVSSVEDIELTSVGKFRYIIREC